MNLDLDGGKLLYALGVLFALGALSYFVRDVVFGLSITVKAALLFVAFIAFLVGGLALDRDVLDVVAYAIAALSYTVFLAYVITRYALAETDVFLLLTTSAVLFVGLGYGVRQQRIDVNRRTAGYVVVALLSISIVFVGVDVVSGDVRYTADLDESTSITVSQEETERDQTRITAGIGTLTVANPSPFTRPADLPSAYGCVKGTETETEQYPIRYDSRGYDVPNRVVSGEERMHDMEARIPAVTNETGDVTFDIEHAPDCDVTREEPTLIVVFTDDVEVA